MHYNGQFVIEDETEIPAELQRAFKYLWSDDTCCYERLVEFNGGYYVAIAAEFDETDAIENDLFMEDVYERAKKNAMTLHEQKLFKSTILILNKMNSHRDMHEVMFLVPAMKDQNVYRKIENEICDHIYDLKTTMDSEKSVSEEAASDCHCNGGCDGNCKCKDTTDPEMENSGQEADNNTDAGDVTGDNDRGSSLESPETSKIVAAVTTEAAKKLFLVICYSVHNKEIVSHDAFKDWESANEFLKKDAENTCMEEMDNSSDDEKDKIDLTIDDDGTAKLSSCDGEYEWTWEIIEV